MPLSDDLRERVVGVVVDGGMSHNAAAKLSGLARLRGFVVGRAGFTIFLVS